MSWLAQQAMAEGEQVKAFMRRLSVPIGDMETDRPPVDPEARGAVSPFRVVGLSTLLIGVLMIVILPWVLGEGTLAFLLDLIIGLALVVFGALVMVRSSKVKTT